MPAASSTGMNYSKNHQKKPMKKFFKNLSEWAFAMYAVCCKHQATDNQFKLRAIVVPHNEWVTLLNLVATERAKQMYRLETITMKAFSPEEDEVYTYLEHLNDIQESIKTSIKPI
jgi:hypothetical protein